MEGLSKNEKRELMVISNSVVMVVGRNESGCRWQKNKEKIIIQVSGPQIIAVESGSSDQSLFKKKNKKKQFFGQGKFGKLC